jgi:hypothetical protein
MTDKLKAKSSTPVDLVASPSSQYVKIAEVMDVCSRLGARLAAKAIHSDETRMVIIDTLMRLIDDGAPLERIMLYELANKMVKKQPYRGELPLSRSKRLRS